MFKSYTLEKFKGKYRIESTRLPGWDYAGRGKYFVTICTNNRVRCFGDVIDGKMILNEMGKIVYKYWIDIPDIFLHTYLDEFQIMPDHVHGIVVIERRDETRSRLYNNNNNEIIPDIFPPTNPPTNPQTNPQTNPPTNPQKISPNQHMSNISPKPGSLSVILGGWKSKCTKEFRQTGYTWHGWQARFHDHIIRNDRALQRIRNYIRNNPANWKG